MITILDAINLSTEFLHKKGIDSPRVNAELLLAFVLKCKRLDLYLLFDRPLVQHELEFYKELIKRRSKFEPLQYITGSVEFYGLEFKVTPAVLIPRPETEILVERIINDCSGKNQFIILDIGCGSGNIGICLALYLKGAKVLCTDLSAEAIEVAIENARKHKVSSDITFLKHDIISEELNFLQYADIIVSNPPYVSANDFSSLQKEIRDFEPRYALTDEADGYLFFRVIAEKAIKKLIAGGRLYFEISQGQSQRVEKIMVDNGFKEIKKIKDYQNIERIIYGVK